jgi:hypothetical protein
MWLAKTCTKRKSTPTATQRFVSSVWLTSVWSAQIRNKCSRTVMAPSRLHEPLWHCDSVRPPARQMPLQLLSGSLVSIAAHHSMHPTTAAETNRLRFSATATPAGRTNSTWSRTVLAKQWISRSQWPRCLRNELSSLARTLGSWVPISLKAWIPMCLFYVGVVLCVGRGLVTGWSTVQGVLPAVYRIKKLRKRPRSNKGL